MTENRKSRRILSMFMRNKKPSYESTHPPDPMPDNAVQVSKENRRTKTPSSPFSFSAWQYALPKSPTFPSNPSSSQVSLVDSESTASADRSNRGNGGYRGNGGNRGNRGRRGESGDFLALQKPAYHSPKLPESPLSPRNFGPRFEYTQNCMMHHLSDLTMITVP